MRILALDTSAKTATVALLENGEQAAHFTFETETHSSTLLPLIETVLKMKNLTYEEIDAYAVSCGPGSFTGVRIGVSTVKGLAFRYRTPCIGVSSLDGMAMAMGGVDGLVVPVMDARRDLVYTAVFRSHTDGTVERLTEDDQVAITDLLERLKTYGDVPVYFTGDAHRKVAENPNAPKTTAHTPGSLVFPSAYGVALAALREWNNMDDKSAFTDEKLLPVYLRKSQAEREREERIAAENNRDL